MTINVKIKILPHGEGLPHPQYETEGAAGMDIRAALSSSITIPAQGTARIPTGFCLEISAGYEVQIRPRSGLAAKHGITVLNAPGTIDCDYRGEVQVLVINHGTNPFIVEHGERIAQMVFAPVTQVTLIEVTELGNTERGEGGFGSTGK